MRILLLNKPFQCLFLFLFLANFIPKAEAKSQLETIFRTPTEDAKPRAYWVWGHGNYDYTRIGEELKAFKEVGLGGVDIMHFGISDSYNFIPKGTSFLSNEMLDGVVYAMKEAKKLDLKMGICVSDGWNAGGDETTQDEMSMNMLFWKDTIQGPMKLSNIGFPNVPKSFTKLYGEFQLFPAIGLDGFPEYYENVSLVAYPMNNDGIISDLSKVITFDASQIKGNIVDIQLPAGKWILQRSIVTPLGQKMWATSRSSKGFIMDHFSQKATEHHFTNLFNRLESRLGSLKGTAFERLYLCSFELEAAVEWTPKLADEFFKLNGYRIEPYIPALSGQKIVDDQTTQRFIHDYRKTISHLFVTNHYLQARKICHDHGVTVCSESGGPGPPLHRVPTEDYQALGAVDVMRGEFWNMKSMTKDSRGGELLSVIKNIAGAAHVYGRKIVEMESFTSQGKHWRENPLDLKKLADYAFCNGMTRVVYHMSSHSPKEAGKPGWSYSAGTHISPNLTWWSMVKPLNDYFSRISTLLQQGNFVADVAYYKGEEVPNFSIGYKYVRESLGAGYDYDDINTEILLQTTEVENGKIKLPCGMTYSVLVLPDNGKMSIEVLRVLENLLQKGATIIGKKPTKVYGLANYKAREAELKVLADKIWGVNAPDKQIKKYGNGFIVTGYTEKELLAKQGISTDFTFQTSSSTSKLDYIHRTTPTEEIYFVRNVDSIPLSTQMQFRVKDMQPQRWNPMTGEMTKLAVYKEDKNGITLAMDFEAFGSTFIIFTKSDAESVHITSVSTAGKEIFPVKKTVENIAYTSSISNNSILFSANKAADYQLKLSDGTSKSIAIPQQEIVKLNGAWDVRFEQGWGFEPIQKMDSLVDWVEHPNEAIKHYSGFASYKLAFTLPIGFLSSNKEYQLDLGKVGEVARIFLNGVEAGVSIFPPHQLVLENVLREGENNMVVEVANTWLNQYLYDIQQPLSVQRLRTNVDKEDFVKNGALPLASGLMGPVQLVSTTKVQIK